MAVLALAGSIPALGANMFFCTWKDEDGCHYGVTNVNPRRFFSWYRVEDCDPKSIQVDTEDCVNELDLQYDDMIRLLNGEFVEIDLSEDAWDWYLHIRKDMRFLF